MLNLIKVMFLGNDNETEQEIKDLDLIEQF